MLDDLSLPLVQDVRTREDHAWVAHPVPGLDGAAHQNLGRCPVMITLVGVMVDDASLSALEQLRKKFKDHGPFPFTANIATATQVKNVTVDDLAVTELAGKPQQYRYVLRLIEHIPPPPPVQPLAAPNLDAGDIMGQVSNALGQLPGLGNLNLDLVNPAPPLRSALDGFASTAGQISAALQPLSDLLG